MTLLDERGIDPATCPECGAPRGQFCDEDCPTVRYSPDDPPPPQPTYSCPCGTGEEPCPVNGRPACEGSGDA